MSMGNVLIVYTTRANETKGIAELIAEGVRQSGHAAILKSTEEVQSEEDLKGYDAYAFGSPTYHGDMMTPMKQILFMGERAELKGNPEGVSAHTGGVVKQPQGFWIPCVISME